MCDKQMSLLLKLEKADVLSVSSRASSRCSGKGLTLKTSDFSNFNDNDNLFATHRRENCVIFLDISVSFTNNRLST